MQRQESRDSTRIQESRGSMQRQESRDSMQRQESRKRRRSDTDDDEEVGHIQETRKRRLSDTDDDDDDDRHFNASIIKLTEIVASAFTQGLKALSRDMLSRRRARVRRGKRTVSANSGVSVCTTESMSSIARAPSDPTPATLQRMARESSLRLYKPPPPAAHAGSSTASANPAPSLRSTSGPTLAKSQPLPSAHASGSTGFENPAPSLTWVSMANSHHPMRLRECLNALNGKCPYCWFSGEEDIGHLPTKCVHARGRRYGDYREAIKAPQYHVGTCYGCGLNLDTLLHGKKWGNMCPDEKTMKAILFMSINNPEFNDIVKKVLHVDDFQLQDLVNCSNHKNRLILGTALSHCGMPFN